jgi:hypothetical protein
LIERVGPVGAARLHALGYQGACHYETQQNPKLSVGGELKSSKKTIHEA